MKDYDTEFQLGQECVVRFGTLYESPPELTIVTSKTLIYTILNYNIL